MKKHHQICLLAVGLLLTLTAGCNNEPARPTVTHFFATAGGQTGEVSIAYDNQIKIIVPATSKCASEVVVGRPLPKSCGPLK